MPSSSIDNLEWSNVKLNTPVAITGLVTTDATPIKVAAVPFPINTTYDITVYFKAVKGDQNTRNCGYYTGVFFRVTGDIAQEGTFIKDLRGILSTTQLVFTPNQTTHELEVFVKGLAATTINWSSLSILIK